MIKQIFVLFLLIPFIGHSQFDHIDVFPNLQGDELSSNVVSSFKPDQILSYGPARDSMFAHVYNEQDSVSCIYTDWTLYLKPGEDPTTFLYMGGSNDGINTEHVFPQSKGASSGNAKSDMHHLFPSRTIVNSDRGNEPFAEIPDNQANKWFYKNQVMTSIPTTNIDLYSEDTNEVFEPRESVKGDVARAMIYFYTMYKEEADNANLDFFEDQKETLINWHANDPVDSLEWIRNYKKAAFQEDKVNPFILDCTLATRMYGGEFPIHCVLSKNVDETLPTIPFSIAPNPSKHYFTIFQEINNAKKVRYILINTYGKYVQNIQIPGNVDSVRFETENIKGGIYFLLQKVDNQLLSYQKVIIL